MKIKGIFILLISGLLAALLLVYLTFQGKSGKQDENAEGSPTIVRILASYEISSGQELLTRLAEQYEQQRGGVNVQIQWIDRENLKKEVCLSIDAGEQLDLVICSQREMSGLMDMETLLEIPGELAGPEFSETLLYPELWEQLGDGERYYGIPFTLDPWVLFCNTDYFERKQSAYPQTWEELLDICEKTAEVGISGLGFGVTRSGDAADFFDAVLYTFAGDYYQLDSESGRKTLELLDAFKRRGCVSKNVINCTPMDAAREFTDGKTLMLMAPLSIRTSLQELKGDMQIHISAFPGEEKQVCAVSGDAVGILKTAGGQAFDFMEFLFEKDVRREIVEKTGTLPLFPDDTGIALPDDVQAVNEFMQEEGGVPGFVNNWFEVSSILANYQYNILVKRSVNLAELLSGLKDEIRVAIMR